MLNAMNVVSTEVSKGDTIMVSIDLADYKQEIAQEVLHRISEKLGKAHPGVNVIVMSAEAKMAIIRNPSEDASVNVDLSSRQITADEIRAKYGLPSGGDAEAVA